jgi:hypothetical protein
MPAPLRVGRSLGGEIGCAFGTAFILWIVVGGIFAAFRLIPLAGVLDGLLAIGLVIWIIIAINRYSAEKHQVDMQNRLYPAMERVWSNLYYCFRDDIVFYGNSPFSNAPVSEMVRLLIDESQRQAP